MENEDRIQELERQLSLQREYLEKSRAAFTRVMCRMVALESAIQQTVNKLCLANPQQFTANFERLVKFSETQVWEQYEKEDPARAAEHDYRLPEDVSLDDRVPSIFDPL